MTIGELLEQKKMLELELSKVELMSERGEVRNDLREVNRQMNELSREHVMKYVDESSFH
jgi:hypothetical protein